MLENFISYDNLRHFYRHCVDRYYIRKSDKGEPMGVASLNGKGQLVDIQIPDSLNLKLRNMVDAMKDLNANISEVRDSTNQVNFLSKVVHETDVLFSIYDLAINHAKPGDIIIDLEGKVYRIFSVDDKAFTFTIDVNLKLFDMVEEREYKEASTDQITKLFE